MRASPGSSCILIFGFARYSVQKDTALQALAAEFNYSETTFVLPPDDARHTARVRIFNRTHEMPFAGHPNVGTGYVLATQGRDRDGVLLFEQLAGLVEVKVDRDGDGVVTGATIGPATPFAGAGAVLSGRGGLRGVGCGRHSR